MSDNAPDTISVHVEADDLIYNWHGDQSEERLEQWALTDALTYDDAAPA